MLLFKIYKNLVDTYAQGYCKYIIDNIIEISQPAVNKIIKRSGV